MWRLREKVLEQRVKRRVTDRIAARINKRLDRLKAESPWRVTYRWEKQRSRLFVVTGPLDWEAKFNARSVKIYVEGSVFLRPVLKSAKEQTISILKEEIELLNR